MNNSNHLPTLSSYRGPSRWRGRYALIISEVIERVGTKDKKTLQQELRRAYPHTYRSGHKYRIWLDEIKRHLGEKPPLCMRKPSPKQAGQTSFFPMTPGEILGAQLVQAGWWIKEYPDVAARLPDELEEMLF